MLPVVEKCDSLPIGTTVIKQSQYAAALEADRIVARANADAAEIRRDAKEEYQRQKQQGYNDGMDQARTEFTQRMISNVVETVDYFKVVEERVVDVVCKSLRKIVGEIDERELIIKIAGQALCWARNQSHVTLRVAPSHAELLRKRVDEMLKNYPAIEVLDISVDEQMQQGDCILETEIGSVNASLELQLTAIESTLRTSIVGAADNFQTDTTGSGEPEPQSDEPS